MTNIPKQLQVNNSDFIVGDTVVFTEEKSCDCDLYEVEAVLDGGLFLGISHYRQAFSARNLRHATVAETKAKRRLPALTTFGDDQHRFRLIAHFRTDMPAHIVVALVQV